VSESLKVRFGAFELDARTGELRKHGVRLKIQDQPFQVLQALLERPGELVTREELQTRIWANDTFVDFDQSLNRAINKVREALSDTAGSPRFVETLPRRGYRFIAHVESVPELPSASVAKQPEPPPPSAAARSYRKTGWVALGLLALVGASLWLARDGDALPPPRVVPLTTLTGFEIQPSFSPDGKQVAFAWTGNDPNNLAFNRDIYIKVVGDERVLQLTTHPANDWFPAWSPDGRQIAFASMRDGGGIYIVSPLGISERKLSSLRTMSRPSWSADGKSLLVAQQHVEGKPGPGDGALYLIPATGGEPRQILAAPPGTWYRDPTYARDGRSLAFVFCTGTLGGPSCTLEVVGLKEGLFPSGEPRPIQQYSDPLGLAWAADGASLIYGSHDGKAGYLWRVDVRGGKAAERLELAGIDALGPAVDVRGGRLAFSRTQARNSDIWRLGSDGKPSAFLTSSLVDDAPQYSPDGQRIAFSSGRGGDSVAIWTANADGTGVNQITRIASPKCGTPRWSPDGQSIAFEASGKAGGGWDIWVVEANGSSPRQVTHSPGDNILPSWSSDGNSIYFTSKRSGRFEIWRLPAHGGKEEQITRNGGYLAFESTERKTLYYTLSQSGTEGLYAKSLPDGVEVQAINDNVAALGLAVFSDGAYYLSCGRNECDIRFYEFADARVQVLHKIGVRLDVASGLTVSPDRRTFLFSILNRPESDLMIIENFR
jgi:Tol biopolymer transport system component/DNA-binding winged helix-turn-helix (wHTH) protein